MATPYSIRSYRFPDFGRPTGSVSASDGSNDFAVFEKQSEGGADLFRQLVTAEHFTNV
jgi:hypothetical protein